MKITIFSILVSITGLFSLSCSSTRDLAQKGLFTFEFKNEEYQIISITAPSGEGLNSLIKLGDNRHEFKAIDQDQDGIIDIIQYGSVSLEEANFIYTFGIKEAISHDKLRGKEQVRIFDYTEEPFRYTIQTYGLYSDVFYNRFTILNSQNNTEELFLDMNADGVLDQAEASDRPFEEVQPLYQRALDEGIRQKRIHIQFDKVIVKTLPKAHSF